MQDRQQDSAGISRRKLVAGAAVGAGALLGVPGVASAARRSPSFNLGSHERRLDSKLGAGHVRRPDRLQGRRALPVRARHRGRARDLGAARDEEGRQGARRDHRADARLRASRSSRRRSPRARSRSSSQFFKETGIKIKFTVTTPADEYATNTRNASSRNSVVRRGHVRDRGDGRLRRGQAHQAARRLRRPKYKPSWYDPKSASPAARTPSTCSRSTTAATTRSRSTTTRSRSSTAAT